MRPYLNDYMRTLSKPREVRVSALLEEARVGKERLDNIVKMLDGSVTSDNNNVTLARDIGDTIIDPSVTMNNIITIVDRVNEMYEISNAIALLLASHSSILGTDVKAIEDELIAMEKMAANFAFLLADSQAYDFAYLESFSDDSNRDTDLQIIPDRSGASFPEDLMAHIDVEEGVLVLPEYNFSEYNLSAELIKGNATAFALNDTDLNNMLNKDQTGWRLDVAAAGPITASLPEANGKSGAQAILEFRLDKEATVSEIKLVPNADLPIEILQISLMPEDNEGQKFEVIEAPVVLDRPITFHFPMQAVLKFHVLINQPVYNKLNRRENTREYRYRKLIRDINNNRRSEGPRQGAFSVRRGERVLQRDALGRTFGAQSIPLSSLRDDRGPANHQELTQAMRYQRTKSWREGSTVRSKIVYETLAGSDSPINNIRRHEESPEMGVPPGEESYRVAPIRLGNVSESGFNYYYSLGFKNVSIGIRNPGFKGAYVARPAASSGDIGEIRIKVLDDNYRMAAGDLSVRHMTSTEYSVSNRSNPESEADWLPIQPIGVEMVEGERLFLDETGIGYFRFEALSAQTLAVYRNGYPIDLQLNSTVLGSPGGIKGVRINLNSISPTDIFTVNYTPAGDPSVVSFSEFGFEDPPLVFAYDATGPGERHLSTSDSNTVTLTHEPYIDPALAAAGGYQPVVVQMDDGTVAINMTNYQTGRNTAMPDDGYYYVQSGNVLIFNKPIVTPFRVYYQYLQNNVRVRVVLRCNAHEFVSPKVDYIHLKAKTRRPDVSRL